MKRVFSVIMILIIVLGLIGFFPAIAVADPKIIYVDVDASGANNGSSWTDAFTDMKDALSVADPGDEIRVARGTYYPGTMRDDSYAMMNGVSIFGGYAGYGETNPDTRDIAAYETIFSGDIGVQNDYSDNCYHVFYHPDGTNLDNSAVLDGCTITGGNADDAEHDTGGGICNENSSPSLLQCSFYRNFAGNSGGAVANINSSPVVTSCTFERNGTDFKGGGLYNESSSPSVTGCTFSSNNATVSGGGVHNDNSSSPVFTDCTFDGNAAMGGGGMLNQNDSSPVITGCRFTNNCAGNGSALSNFSSSPVLVNSIFTHNSAYFHGGAIYNLYDSSPSLVNCTLYQNDSIYGGNGIYNVVSCCPVVTNCILWDHSSGEITNYDSSSVPIVAYSDIRGGYTGTGNIDSDPLLDTDIQLLEHSPCIDAGNNAAVPPGTTIDFDGDPRFLDDTETPDTGTGVPPIVDMGADEFSGQSPDTGIIYVDVDASGTNNGFSWMNAFTDLQDALSAAGSGDEIRVAQGTYYPGTERSDSFSMKTGVSITGGYAGYGEIDPDARDFVSNKTVLSGDIGTPDDHSDNCYHVFYHPDGTDLDNAAVLEGFTITGGNADGGGDRDIGGGMYNAGCSPALNACTFIYNSANNSGGGIVNIGYSSPVLTDCIFERNSALTHSGGGMFNSNKYSSPVLINCVFYANDAELMGGAIRNTANCTLTGCIFEGNSAGSGGGLYTLGPSMITDCTFTANCAYTGGGLFNGAGSPVVDNCTFTNNTGTYGGGLRNDYSSCTVTGCLFFGNVADIEGAGMLNYESPEMTVTDCSFTGNTATFNGGGMHNRRSPLSVTACTFENNTANHGSGISNNDNSSIAITRSVFRNNSAGEGGGLYNTNSSSPLITNSLFETNSACNGGGIYNSRNSTSLLYNCTFTGNSVIEASYGGIICNLFDSSPVITNCILWDVYPDEIYNNDPSCVPVVTYSDIQGGYPGTGNIDSDPLLDELQHLVENSPCIDAGDNSAIPSGIFIDIDGDPRFLDDTGTPDTGAGTPPIIDIGADEFTGQSTGSGLLIVRTEGKGNITIRYNSGSAVLTAVPDPRWEFDSWSGDYNGTDNPLTVILDIDKSVTAHFIKDIPGIEPVTVILLDSNGQGIAGAEVKYYDRGWQEFGFTGTDGSVTASIFTRQYKFRIYYGGASIDQKQDVSVDPMVVFQTVNVTVELRDSNGYLMDEGAVKYYAGGWQEFGTISGSQVNKELLPKSYKFRMYYGGASIDQKQDISVDPTVVFQTVNVTVELRDSNGYLMDEGVAKYYAGGWQEFGTTSGGQVSKELLPKSYKFRMYYGGASIDLTQDIEAGFIVVFPTGQVISESDTCVKYYAGGWKEFMNGMELLPKTYKFRFSDGTPDTSYSIKEGTVNHIY